MKTIVHLCAMAFLSLAIVSCTKSDVNNFHSQTTPDTGPTISAKISKNITQPAEMELGTANAVIHVGETVTIFVPYSVANETFTSAKITMTDDATGSPVNTYDLVPFTDASASELILPSTLLKKSEFFFITFVADESYAGKTISISTNLEGESTNSTDVLNAAFSVAP